MIWLHGWMNRVLPTEPRPEPPDVLIHGHCWVDHNHVLKLKVRKKEQHAEHVWECGRCDVREKVAPCRSRCIELVTTT